MNLAFDYRLTMRSRTLLLGIGLLLLAATLGSATDWPRLRGADQSATSPDPFATEWPKAGPPLAWQTIYAKNYAHEYGSLCVCDGRVFTLKGEACAALDSARGTQIWTNGLKGGPGLSTPTVSEGKVYVYTSNGKLFCLDCASGKTLWQHDLAKEYKTGINENSQSPWVEDRRVFVSLPAATHCIKAFDAGTGALLWEGHTNAANYSSPVGATIHGVRQIIFPDSYGLAAVAPATGQLLWRHLSSEVKGIFKNNGPSPLVADDIVLAYPKTEAIRIEYTNGVFSAKTLWTNSWFSDAIENFYTAPVIYQDHAYILESTGKLSCHQLSDGQIKWKTQLTAGSMILVTDYLVILSQDGSLILAKASPESYQELAWGRTMPNGRFLNYPAYANGKLYARNPYEILCFDLNPTPPLCVRATLAPASGRLQLTVSCANGGVISSNRAPKIGIVWSPDLKSPISQWTPISSKPVFKNGVLSSAETYFPGTAARFYSVIEPAD